MDLEFKIKEKETLIESYKDEIAGLKRELSDTRLYRNPSIPALLNALSETLREGNIPKFKDLAFQLNDATQATYSVGKLNDPMKKLFEMFKHQNFVQLPPRVGGYRLKLGSTTVIGARPAGGKTKTMVNWMYELVKLGHPCVFFSSEMEESDLYLFFCQSWLYEKHGLSVSYWDMHKVLYTEEYKGIRSEFAKWIAENRHLFLVIESAGYTATDIVMGIENASSLLGCQPFAVFIDYLQIIPGERGVRASRKEQMDNISSILTIKCKRMKKSIFVMASQLNRDSYGNKAPSIHDFKESGAIEQDATLMLILERPKGEDGSLLKGLDISCVKDRFGGRTGKLSLYLDPPTYYTTKEPAEEEGGF